MSDIQRYGDPSRDYMIPAHGDGFVVLYADHVAAVAAARDDERLKGFAGEPFAAAYAEGQRQGVKAARDAVAEIKPGPTIDPDGMWMWEESLAAIDALEKP